MAVAAHNRHPWDKWPVAPGLECTARRPLSTISMNDVVCIVPIYKSVNLVEIKAREKLNRRHMVDIPRIQFFAQRRYLSAFGGSGKLAIYG